MSAGQSIWVFGYDRRRFAFLPIKKEKTDLVTQCNYTQTLK